MARRHATFRLDEELLAELDAASGETRVPKGEIVRQILGGCLRYWLDDWHAQRAHRPGTRRWVENWREPQDCE